MGTGRLCCRAALHRNMGEWIIKTIEAVIEDIAAHQGNVYAKTSTPAWSGERMDDDLVVVGLFELEPSTSRPDIEHTGGLPPNSRHPSEPGSLQSLPALVARRRVSVSA